MLLVSWQQWSEVFERLGWASPLPEELWHRMGGGTERQIDWPEIYRLILSTGWSERHAQTLWLTLNNFAQPAPEPEPVPEAAPEPEPVIAPAPWERNSAALAVVAQDVEPAEGKKARSKKAPSISMPTIKLPAFLAQVDKRLLIGLAAAVVLLIGYMLFFSGGSDNSSSSSSNPPAPAAGAIANQNFLRTYFSWKQDLPNNLCLMTKDCDTPALKKRLQSIGTTSENYKFMSAASLYKLVGSSILKNPAAATFKTVGKDTQFQVAVVAANKQTIQVCGTLVADQGQVKILAAKDYKPANFMIGSALQPCAAR